MKKADFIGAPDRIRTCALLVRRQGPPSLGQSRFIPVQPFIALPALLYSPPWFIVVSGRHSCKKLKAATKAATDASDQI